MTTPNPPRTIPDPEHDPDSYRRFVLSLSAAKEAKILDIYQSTIDPKTHVVELLGKIVPPEGRWHYTMSGSPDELLKIAETLLEYLSSWSPQDTSQVLQRVMRKVDS